MSEGCDGATLGVESYLSNDSEMRVSCQVHVHHNWRRTISLDLGSARVAAPLSL